MEDSVEPYQDGLAPVFVLQEWFGGTPAGWDWIPVRNVDKEVGAEVKQSHLVTERNRIDVPVHHGRPGKLRYAELGQLGFNWIVQQQGIDAVTEVFDKASENFIDPLGNRK